MGSYEEWNNQRLATLAKMEAHWSAGCNFDEWPHIVHIIFAQDDPNGSEDSSSHEIARGYTLEEAVGNAIDQTYDGPPDQDYEQAYINRQHAGFREPNI